jgi:uncharacterized protein YlaN (UPF0358 family)
MAAEDLIVIYHKGIEFAAKLSLLDNEELEIIQSRLKQEAARASEEDSVALRCLANACQAYKE